LEDEDTSVDDAGMFNCLLSFNWGEMVAVDADVLVAIVVIVVVAVGVDFFLLLFRSTDMN